MEDPARHGRAVEPVEWLESALERLRACSMGALRTLERGDLVGLAALIAEREDLLRRVVPLLSTVRTPQLAWTLEGTLAADARLVDALSSHLAGVALELRRLQERSRVAVTDGAGRSAGLRVDLVR